LVVFPQRAWALRRLSQKHPVVDTGSARRNLHTGGTPSMYPCRLVRRVAAAHAPPDAKAAPHASQRFAAQIADQGCDG